MQIKNTEALKTWLTARLENICDADPAALAKYVVALVRKDKAVGELEEICIDQLEVFLADSTVSFVKTLFEVLQNNTYIPVGPTPSTTLPPEVTTKVNNAPKTSSTVKPSTIQQKPINTIKPSNISNQLPATNQPTNTQNSAPKQGITSIKIEHKPPSPKPVTKRLLSTEESFRPQAAESSALDEDDRDFKRTRKPIEDIEEKVISISHNSSYKSKKRRNDDSLHDNSASRSKIAKEEHNDQQNIDNKQQINEGTKQKEDNETSGAEKTENSSDRDISQNKSEGSNLRGKHIDNKFNKNRSHNKGRHWNNKRARCRDYEERGYCMRGEFCPFDHGNDPLVVEDVNIPGIVLGFPHPVHPHPAGFLPERPMNPAAVRLPTIRPGMPPIQYPIRPPVPPRPNVLVTPNDHSNTPRNVNTTQHAHVKTEENFARKTKSSSDEQQADKTKTQSTIPTQATPLQQYKDGSNGSDVYNPEQPSFDRVIEKPPVWSRLGVPPRYPVVPQRNRELLQVIGSERSNNVSPVPKESTSSVTIPTTVGQVAPVVQTDSPTTSNRDTGTPPVPVQAPRKYTNTILEIKKLPADKNNISTLNDYFQRFGKIVNIQVNALGQPDMALIQFSHNAEANKAITCSDAVFGNRFIRVFWYKPDAEKKNVNIRNTDNQDSSSPSVVEKPSVPPTMFRSGKTSFKSPTISTTSNRDHNSQHLQEIMKKKLVIQKQKQELLEKQIAQQKLLINKLEEHKNLTVKEKENILQTLKAVSSNISTLQSDIKVTTVLAKSKECPLAARQIAKKELLDRELDLITHEQTGEDTTELRYRVEELKKEAQSLGLLGPSQTRGRGRGVPRGVSRGRARGKARSIVSRAAATLDKRPKQVLVEVVNTEDINLVTQRFKEFGDINRLEHNKDDNKVIFTFGSRKQAEMAVSQIPSFNIKQLKASWYRPPLPQQQQQQQQPGVVSADNVEKTTVDLSDQEVEDLLLDDVEDEEEEEERSWKR